MSVGRWLSLLRFARRYPRVSRAEITAFQTGALRRLVAHAHARVPYYQRLLDAHGVRPEHIRSLADLALVPVTGKRDIQMLPASEVVARGVDPRRLVRHRTSGATGEPLTIRRTAMEERLHGLFRLRALGGYGRRLRDRRAVLGIVRAGPGHRGSLAERAVRALGVLPRTEVDCLLPPREIVRALRRIAPDVLSGPPAVLSEVARAVGDDDRRLIRPRYVTVGGDVLTASMRRQIGEAFRAPVYEFYASHECSIIAWQCARTGALHVCEDNVIAEVLREDGRPAEPGETGEIVLTRLHAHAMPFIRYRLGDLVTRGAPACGCGEPFSTLGGVRGRMLDYFPLADGRVVHPYDLVLAFLPVAEAWMRQYQLVQERPDRITLRVAAARPPDAGELAALEGALRSRLGPGIDAGVVLVDDIAIEPSGKHRVSRSLVRTAYESGGDA